MVEGSKVLLLHLHIDDPLDIASVHGAAGLWGALVPGLRLAPPPRHCLLCPVPGGVLGKHTSCSRRAGQGARAGQGERQRVRGERK